MVYIILTYNPDKRERVISRIEIRAEKDIINIIPEPIIMLLMIFI